jgi:hypothetical protein
VEKAKRERPEIATDPANQQRAVELAHSLIQAADTARTREPQS